MTAVMSFTRPPRVGRVVRSCRTEREPARLPAGEPGRIAPRASDRGRVTVAGADPHHRVDRADPDLPVADAALLPAVAADLTDGHPGDAERLQRLPDVLPLVRLDHRSHELHAFAPSETVLAARTPEDGRPPLMLVPRSYADSPCWSLSMPSTSASVEMRQPIVYLIARAMMVVKTPV